MMSLFHQRRWLEAEQARNQRLLDDTMVLGRTILEKAAIDLAAITALLATLEAMEQPSLFPLEEIR